MEIGTDEEPQHWHDDIGEDVGIVSVAGIVMGVAGATPERSPVLVAGVAGLVAGALSMGAGEYVSVSTQRDSEQAMLALEAEELQRMPETELRELAKIYERKGLSRDVARRVAQELTEHDALAAHAEAEFGIDKENLTKPWHAALASMVAFTVGAVLPLLVITLSPHAARIWATVVAVAIALGIAGFVSARLGYSPWGRAVLRNVGGGLVAMGITYAVGAAVGPHL
jgi:VIT1/CCC1 family predicted Fe2+/Mn2+ transporter